MKTNWTVEDLAASWLILPEDQKAIEGTTNIRAKMHFKT